MATTHSVYELDVRLREIEPPIWRTIEVPGRATLADVLTPTRKRSNGRRATTSRR